MKLSKVETIENATEVQLQKVTFKDVDGSLHTYDRIRKGTTIVAICHDVVNGQVIVTQNYRVGAMQHMADFPSGRQCDDENYLQAVQRIVKAQTGCEAKSSQLLQEYMGNPEIDFNPTLLFYCTVDSREVDYGECISAKQLIREVEQGEHNSVNLVLGAWYLKMLNKGLVR